MNAPALRERLPVLRAMLDEQLSFGELSRLLDEEDDAALALARRVLHGPLADVLARPGKEVRARLVAYGYAIARRPGSPELPPELPQLVEMLHAGSLVVDDIEDEATERRGAPALHVTHGVPVALNAGNWLYFWPLVALSRLPLAPPVLAAMHAEVSSTMLRCHHGQALDLGVRVHEVSPRELPAAVLLSTRLKTGSLLELSLRLGALAADAPPETVKALGLLGREAGIALQTLDDLGSVTSPARRAKALEDLGAARLTWPWAFLAESADELTVRSLQRALASQKNLDHFLDAFRAHVDPAWKRAPRARLDAAIARLREHLAVHQPGPSAKLESLVRDLRTLEQSYE